MWRAVGRVLVGNPLALCASAMTRISFMLLIRLL
jgi:hypothetical protein